MLLETAESEIIAKNLVQYFTLKYSINKVIEKDDYIRLLDNQIKKSHINCREDADQAFTDEVNYYYNSYYY